MTRIVMAGMPAAGHLNPTLPLVRELVRDGIEIAYYTDEKFRPAVEAAGGRWRSYPPGTVSEHDIAEATRKGGPLSVIARILPAVEVLAYGP
jgi:UDP:flavonoid glycosyltransferase YjiC (YdhE family)